MIYITMADIYSPNCSMTSEILSTLRKHCVYCKPDKSMKN